MNMVLVDRKQPLPEFEKYKLIRCVKCRAVKPDSWFYLEPTTCSKCVRRMK